MLNQDSEGQDQMPSNGSVLKKSAITLAVLLLLGTTGAAGYFYKQLAEIKKNPNKVAIDETKALIEKISKLIVLPASEQPTVATVTDPSKLKDQAFFAHAVSGDKVLIYTNAKKAFLYNPAQNKIVEVAPINIGDASTVSGTSTDKPAANTTK